MSNLRYMRRAFFQLLDGIVGIVSFGRFRPTMTQWDSLNFARAEMRRTMKHGAETWR